MSEIRKRPAPVAPGREARKDNTQHKDEDSQSPLENQRALSEVFLAECRCAVLRTKLTTVNIEAVGVALKYNLVTVEQAMELLNAHDALDWLDLIGGLDNG